MKALVHLSAAAVCSLMPHVWGQTLPVDWLLPSASVDGRFLLLDDSSGSVGEAEVDAVVGFPLEAGAIEKYDGASWQDSGLVPENLSGEKSVDGFRVRVAPFGGAPMWSLSISALVAGDWYFAVGSLYRDSTASHGPVKIEATQGGGTLPVEFLGVSGWDGGAGSLQGNLDWNVAMSELSPSLGNDGESGMGFFRIRNFGGPNSSLSFTVPEGFSAGAAGDDVVFAVGRSMSIPEPSSSVFLLLGCFWLGKRRR